MSIIRLERVEKIFGGLRAIGGVSFEVAPKQIFGLIGPNGAGKTTIFNVVTGVYQPDGGKVVFDGTDISGWSPARVAARGIARTFQNIRLFRAMTVRENVIVAGHKIHRANMLDAVLRNGRFDADERAFTDKADELLEIMGLRELADEEASSLPYGSQRRLEIARALMLEPKVLLLDEPAAGMNSSEADKLEDQIRFLRDELSLTIVLVEHNMSVVMSVCERIHVVDHGETIAEGPPSVVKADPKVLAAYLGEETPEAAIADLRAVHAAATSSPESSS
ncbi:MAG: ABC transporter ATP-binding protein [Deltaproteobacteria bacterium]|nr:ABC transporter ATP-binding protein [Deltaproteobacteria bacterium]